MRKEVHNWKPEQVAFIKKNYGRMTAKGIAVALGETPKVVLTKINYMLNHGELERTRSNFKYASSAAPELQLDEITNIIVRLGGSYNVIKEGKVFIKGKVIQITDGLIFIECKNYTTTISKTDIAIGNYRMELIK